MTTGEQKIKKTTIANKAKVEYFCINAKISTRKIPNEMDKRT